MGAEAVTARRISGGSSSLTARRRRAEPAPRGSSRAKASIVAIEVGRADGLGQIAVGAGAEHRRLERVRPRQDHDPDLRPALSDHADETDPGIEIGQLRIEHDDVRDARLERLDRRGHVTDRAGQLEPGGQADEGGHRRADPTILVDDEDPDRDGRRRAGGGMVEGPGRSEGACMRRIIGPARDLGPLPEG